METNVLPRYDDSDNPTGCCPRFSPEGWDGRRLSFHKKPFIRATTRSMLHVPLDMGRVFGRVQKRIKAAGGYDADDLIVLSRDLSPWRAEHLFSASVPVPGEERVLLSGEYITRVFEGPYRDARVWHAEMESEARAAGVPGGMRDEIYFFYTTCPKCAKTYGKNYVVGVARIA